MAFPTTLDRDDPVDLARHLYSEFVELLPGQLMTHAAREAAAYRRALDDLRRRHPADDGFGRPLTVLDEAAVSWVGEAFWDGVKFGVAAARLRRDLLALQDAALCPSCKGVGTTGVVAPYDPERIPVDCGRCGGEGYVVAIAAEEA